MRNRKLIVIFCIFAFLTLLIVLSSVVFSVQSVYAYCYNENDPDTEVAVVARETNGISRGRSIFMLDEDAVARRVESALPDVRVVNVERKFPNRVYINYVKLLPYVVYETGDGAVITDNELSVLYVADKQESYPALIRLKTVGEPQSVAERESLFTAVTKEGKAALDVLGAIERIDFNYAVERFDFIDVSRAEEYETVFVGTRTGTVFELQGTDKLLDKMQLAVSVYQSKDTVYMNGGTIIVHGNADGGVVAEYTRDNRYGAGA